MSQIITINATRAAAVFFILHFLLYPASNAYNSYMDRDTESIGAVKSPKPPTVQLYHISILLDIAAVIAGYMVSIFFMTGVLLFILASKGYSYRGIRLKRYGMISFILAAAFQGGMVYFLTYHGSTESKTLNVSFTAVVAAALLVGSFYPLTQIYQHRQDSEDGITSLSLKLGYTGTFVFSACIFFFAIVFMGYYFAANLELDRFLVFLLFMIPVLMYFFWWFSKVRKDRAAANFKNSLRMNVIAATCTNAAFITLLTTQ